MVIILKIRFDCLKCERKNVSKYLFSLIIKANWNHKSNIFFAYHFQVDVPFELGPSAENYLAEMAFPECQILLGGNWFGGRRPDPCFGVKDFCWGLFMVTWIYLRTEKIVFRLTSRYLIWSWMSSRLLSCINYNRWSADASLWTLRINFLAR